MAAGDWWTMNLSPWSGCKDLALPPEQRAEGCRRCWLPSLLSGPRGRAIHGDHPPHEIVLHPGRLAQALRKREPQRYGWINGEARVWRWPVLTMDSGCRHQTRGRW